jgi:hypothetical protein
MSFLLAWEEGGGPQTDKNLPHRPFPGKFLDNDFCHCFLSVSSFYGVNEQLNSFSEVLKNGAGPRPQPRKCIHRYLFITDNDY